MAKPVVRLTVNLSADAAEQLAKLAAIMGTNQTTALHKAIFTTSLLVDKRDEGFIVEIRDVGNDSVQQLQF
jgi:hypothetical protein